MNNNSNNILIEPTTSRSPQRADALASFVDGGFVQVGGLCRATQAKDLMAFGSVLQHTQHNIGLLVFIISWMLVGCLIRPTARVSLDLTFQRGF